MQKYIYDYLTNFKVEKYSTNNFCKNFYILFIKVIKNILKIKFEVSTFYK